MRNQKIYKKIEAAFKNLKIALKNSLMDLDCIFLPESVTNQFLKVEDITGNFYLIRLNGKLWSPFTRTDEENNLTQLVAHQINSNVIFNDLRNNFQICRFIGEDKKFNTIFNSKKHNVLNDVGRAIRKVHQSLNFNNVYDISLTLKSSFKRIKINDQNKLYDYYMLILSMLISVNSGREHFVSSHNDLLPSSIYCEPHGITLVDWEYAGMNHRSYDLALFSRKASLTSEQEEKLISAYDPEDNLNMSHSMIMMKPIISFLLLVWSSSAIRHDDREMVLLVSDVQNAILHQSIKRLTCATCLMLNRQRHTLAQSAQQDYFLKSTGLLFGTGAVHHSITYDSLNEVTVHQRLGLI